MKKAILYIAALILVWSPALAQKKSKKSKKGNPPAAVPPPSSSKKMASISDKTKNCTKQIGMFTLFTDSTDGHLYLLVKKEQLGQEFIHFTYTENGVLDAGFHRGQFRGSRIFKIKKYYDNIAFEQQNTNFYFDPKNEISKSANANISTSTLAFEKIVAADEKKGEYLLDADELFQSEKLHQIKPSPRFGSSPMSFSLGSLSKSKTHYEKVKTYPQNTDIIVKYVFDNPYPLNGGGEEVTDARSVDIVVQHSFIQMPENNFKPRFDDPRIGYFSEEINDMTSKNAVNYRDLIHRWDLQKKDPTAAKSEPVKPITWWIENSTPHELRATIKEAALSWNKAFEPLGFINAVQVFEQPDTATWDAGDIRYNVLRWTSSPNPPFGGYGPSFVNPRTGEILGADIMFEYVFITNRINAEKLFESKGGESHFCNAGDYLHMETILGMEMLKAAGASDVEVTKLIKESLYYLILHEMGHTMGLMHNMKASQLHSPAELKDETITNKTGLIGSVMDYPALNLHHIGSQDIQYCQTNPGPYDMWAIEYGYSIGMDNEEAEGKRLAAILAKSSDKNLTFGNDADDMRSPGKGIDPRVMINDLSSDGITYSIERIELCQKLMPGLMVRYGNSGESYQELRNAWSTLSSNYMQMVGIISRYVGGVYVERVAPESGQKVQPLTPVSLEDQRRAMAALAKYAFAPDAMKTPTELMPFLQTQRRGFNLFAKSEDPKLHSLVESMQINVLSHLLSPSVLARLTDTKEYGNKYSVGDLFGDLTAAIFNADFTTAVNTHRQILQINYVEYLTAIAGFGAKQLPFDPISKARATAQLLDIQKRLKTSVSVDKETKDHRTYLIQLIDKAFEK